VGVVSERYKSRGVLINAGGMNSQAIMSLVKIDSVYATFFLNEADASKISVNMEVQIKTDIYPEKEFKGTVKSISPEIDKKTHTARVKVELKNPDYKLKPGMFIRSEVVTGKKEKVILIQSRLIKLLEENVAEVFVLKPTSEPGFFNVFKVKVKPGKKKEDRIEILDGLKEGDLIAAEHLSRLRDGLKVKALVE
ncbi:MAG: efflux RND transporter periplasmic adaptor subunit, partial [Leptospiraceae bacterium]|nr:efflux RND transporter periplasmic adaptor subunit [Leptospiraceae bacterium]